MNTEKVKPFSCGYVLRTTAKHVRRSIDISIRKTFARIKEFDGDPKKGHEIFETLSALHSMRSSLDAFQEENKELFSKI